MAGVATMLIGIAGTGLGFLATYRGLGPVSIAWLLPLAGMHFAAGATAGLFMIITGLVGTAAGVFSVGYFRHESSSHFAKAMLPLFLLSMLIVPLADSVTTFLVLWELMALISLFAVLTDHQREVVREAGRWYAAMTHLGFGAILLGLVILASSGGADSFSLLSARAGALSSSTRSAVFMLTFLGFGSKAGLIPLHVWLPRAHPEAPSPVSALMSAAMVAMGIYGIVRIDIQILGPGPRWWAVILLAVGAASGIYGVLQASVATDLKRLLAYSTTENMGLVTLAIGAGMLFAHYGERIVADIAITAAVLHVINHAAFKTLAFLGAGSVLVGTGTRDLDRLGGLVTAMPATTVMFSIAALGASGLPLGAGFISEWLLLQGLIHSRSGTGTLLALVMPVGVGVVALTTGLGVAAMVKAFGVGFLARPRSPGAANAQESPLSMQLGMAMAATACVVLAIDPAVVAPILRRVLLAIPFSSSTVEPHLGVLLQLPGIAGSISPSLLALAVFIATALVFLLARQLSRSRSTKARPVDLWACGGGPLTERMEYTATSFAEPLQRIFDDVIHPDTDLEITHFEESRYLLERVQFRSRITDSIETLLYRPILKTVETWAAWVRRAHSGNVHRYLAYGALGLLVVLAVAR